MQGSTRIIRIIQSNTKLALSESPTRCLKKTLGTLVPPKIHPDKQTVIKLFASSQSCRDAMTLYEFTFQHPNVAAVTWEYDDCTDDMDAAYKANARAKEINYKLMDVRKY